MAKTSTRHVVPAGPNKWAVKEPGKDAPRSTHHTQGAAERAAKKDLGTAGGNVIIHRPDGTFRDGDTIAPARDLFPPRDTKH